LGLDKKAGSHEETMRNNDPEMTAIPTRTFWICLIFLVGCYGPTIYAGIFNLDLYAALLAEDGPLENAATLFILLASILFGLSYFKYKEQRPYLFLVLALLLLFVFLEEISWGQRFFNIETPETFKRINAQGELNLHNYNPIYKYVNGIVYVGLDLYFIGVPLLLFVIKDLHSFLVKLKIPIPSPATAFLMFFNYLLFTYFFEGFLDHRGTLGAGEINYGEMLETGIELAFLFFAIECFTRGITWARTTDNANH
jgi:hypothetical protein